MIIGKEHSSLQMIIVREHNFSAMIERSLQLIIGREW